MLFLKNEKVFKQLWMNTFDKVNLLKRQLKPQLALAREFLAYVSLQSGKIWLKGIEASTRC